MKLKLTVAFVVLSSIATLAVSGMRRGPVPQPLADALLLVPWFLLPWREGA